MKRKVIIAALIMTTILAGCGQNNDNAGLDNAPTAVETTTESAVSIEEPAEPKEPEIDFELIMPNEAGKIMVLMYHGIDIEEKEFVRTPDNFRADLEELYKKGYRPISMKDYVTGNIDIEAGMSPVVITFDDGLQNQFNVTENESGEMLIDPDCAVGILTAFNKEHPDFSLEATFFINANPFRQPEYLDFKFNYIVDNGMDIGNHTKSHINLYDQTDADVERVAENMAYINDIVKEYVADYDVLGVSLPYGGKPQTELVTAISKESEEHGYKNEYFLEVGWDPDFSPFRNEFDPYTIHRVRASDLQKYVKSTGMYDWIERLEEGKMTKYISDGYVEYVTIPNDYMDVLDETKLNGKALLTY